MLDQISAIRGRLDQARQLPDVLSASWDAFDLLAAACRQGQNGSRETFATYAFAATAATEGQIAVTIAPALPARPLITTSDHHVFQAEEKALTGALAGLAQLLHTRLAAATGLASTDADQQACADAALHASQVARLLDPGVPS